VRIAYASFVLALAACKPPPTATPQPGGDAKAKAAIVIQDAPWRVGPRSEAPKPEAKVEPTAVLIRGARLLIGDGTEIAVGHVLLANGKIAAVGKGDGEAPRGATIVDARGKTVTPGLIDTHSHLGVYPNPSVSAHRDGNEMTNPTTPGVRAVDAVWVQDPGFERAVAGGVTTIQVLPGSGNLIGGRAVTLKLRHATAAHAMQFEGAPDGLKMACGENPKRVYGERQRTPMTRMGNLAMQRDAYLQAQRLIDEWDQWRDSERRRLDKDAKAAKELADKREQRKQQQAACRDSKQTRSRCRSWQAQWEKEPLDDLIESEPKLPPKRDLDLETLAGAIEGRVLVHIHCYRSDDMANMLALADEIGFSVRSFHHALEAYKIRSDLAKRHVSVSTWADWWGFKMEAYDGIPENLALVHSAGARAIVHSDSREGIRRLNQEAAKGLHAGRRAGLQIAEADAMKWLTLNPAWALGVDDRVGSLTAGKDADVVLWDRDPFSVYASAAMVFVDGVLRFDRAAKRKPWSDFEAEPSEATPQQGVTR
jgi:imidazolonepropionase-like amidohydrolase